MRMEDVMPSLTVECPFFCKALIFA